MKPRPPHRPRPPLPPRPQGEHALGHAGWAKVVRAIRQLQGAAPSPTPPAT